jgi:branched-chain amino acid transport system substrate-binding protein
VRAGFDPETTFVTDGLISGDLAEGAGEDAVNGLRGTAPGVPDGDPSEEAFDELYAAAEPRDVDRMTFDAQNFDAVILCYLAAVAAGSTDGADMAGELQDISGPGGDKYTFEQLPDAIRALQDGNDIDYEGAAGPLDLNDDGDPTAGVYDLYRYRNGEIDVFDEVPVEEPET